MLEGTFESFVLHEGGKSEGADNTLAVASVSPKKLLVLAGQNTLMARVERESTLSMEMETYRYQDARLRGLGLSVGIVARILVAEDLLDVEKRFDLAL